jgi:hypothetical protein
MQEQFLDTLRVDQSQKREKEEYHMVYASLYSDGPEFVFTDLVSAIIILFFCLIPARSEDTMAATLVFSSFFAGHVILHILGFNGCPGANKQAWEEIPKRLTSVARWFCMSIWEGGYGGEGDNEVCDTEWGQIRYI